MDGVGGRQLFSVDPLERQAARGHGKSSLTPVRSFPFRAAREDVVSPPQLSSSSSCRSRLRERPLRRPLDAPYPQPATAVAAVRYCFSGARKSICGFARPPRRRDRERLLAAALSAERQNLASPFDKLLAHHTLPHHHRYVPPTGIWQFVSCACDESIEGGFLCLEMYAARLFVELSISNRTMELEA
jgi:hypothetical protein